MNDIRANLLTVLIHIIHIKVFRNCAVELNGNHGIFLAIHILGLNIDLGTIEGCLSVCLHKWDLLLLKKLSEHVLGGFPIMLISQIFLFVGRIPLGKAEGYILLKTKYTQNVICQIEAV